MKDKIKKTFHAVRKSLPSGAQVSGAVQGVIGDKLPKRFVTEMGFYAENKPLLANAEIRKPHVVVFVHGSADTELGWSVKPGEQNFGERLTADFAVQALYLRY